MGFNIILVTLACTGLAWSLNVDRVPNALEARQDVAGSCVLVNEGPCGAVGACTGTDGFIQCVSKVSYLFG